MKLLPQIKRLNMEKDDSCPWMELDKRLSNWLRSRTPLCCIMLHMQECNLFFEGKSIMSFVVQIDGPADWGIHDCCGKLYQRGVPCTDSINLILIYLHVGPHRRRNIYRKKEHIRIAGRFVKTKFVTPSLVIETSRLTVLERLQHPIRTTKRVFSKPEDSLPEVVLRSTLEERFRDIAITTRNTKQNKGVYRSILLVGPPGTGKTLFSKVKWSYFNKTLIVSNTIDCDSLEIGNASWYGPRNHKRT